MSAQARIEKLREELDELQKGLDPAERDALVKSANEERDKAIYRAEQAQNEAMTAKAELQKLRNAMQWTMDCLRISDLLMGNFVCDEIPSSSEGWLPLNYCPEDTARLEWINRMGRTSANPNGFHIILPCNIHDAGQEEIPEIYNIRCMIDVARKHPSFQGDRKP